MLILTEGVHQAIPDAPAPANGPVYMTPPPPQAPAAAAGAQDDLRKNGIQTDADRLRERYKQIGDAQNHKFGEGTPGSKPPDFNLKLPNATPVPAGQPPAAPPKPATATPPAGTPPAAAQAPRTAPAPAPGAPVTAVPRPDGSPAPRKTTAPAPPPPEPPKPTKPVDPFL